MNKKILIGIIAAVFIIVVASIIVNKNNKQINITNMKISSSAFENNSVLPVKYTCDGQKISPPLEIADVPAGAKSLAVIFDDPDAPSGTFTHWTLWNISSSTTEIAENSVPAGAVIGASSVGAGYVPPCPHSGTHRYFFKVYALDTMLSLPAGSKVGELESAMSGHIIGEAELVGLYKRE
jgi:Raf kinase inhibitor-like YbhB/YbcL family protein